jgi:hypothetical protein
VGEVSSSSKRAEVVGLVKNLSAEHEGFIEIFCGVDDILDIQFLSCVLETLGVGATWSVSRLVISPHFSRDDSISSQQLAS